MTVYPRWYAILCCAFSLVMLYAIGATLKRPTASLFIKIFTLIGCDAAVVSGFAFAYHIALGHPFKKDADASPAMRWQTP